MKKYMWIFNLIFLIINIILLVSFTVYTFIGSNPLGSYIAAGDTQIQLVIALAFEFCFLIISAIFAKVLRKDLSFKGPDVLKYIPKAVAATVCLVTFALIVYTAVFGISAEFAVMAVVMLFSILIQIGITRLLKSN